MGEGGAIFTNNIELKRVSNHLEIGEEIVIVSLDVENTCKKRFEWQLGKLTFWL